MQTSLQREASIKNRLVNDLVEAGRIGRNSSRAVRQYEDLDPERGVNRQEGTQANRELREFAVERMKDAGLKVSFDRFGNMFGRKQGAASGEKAVLCGSHLDSVANGGMFDGALGVFAGIEAVRRLRGEGFVHKRPIEVVAFTGEEGSAFEAALLGSSALTGKIGEEEALSLKDSSGRTLEQALLESGFKGSVLRDLGEVEYFLELHVEQGPVLFAEKIPIGVVENITGILWIAVVIRGVENHAGTTPMNMRRDALAAGAEIVGFVRALAEETAAAWGSSTVGTVGRLHVFPNGTNIVPGRVELGIDMRDGSRAVLEEMKDQVIEFKRGLEQKYKVRIETRIPAFHPPVFLSREVVEAVEASAGGAGLSYIKMNSGAGHDAQNVAERVKTGMIFVPSRDGVSHSPMEWTGWEDIERGVQVLTGALKILST